MRLPNAVWRIRSINWQVFDRLVRSSDAPLLGRFGDFRNPVLVAGCQRSGTTAVTEVLSGAPEITRFKLGVDNELDGALILAGTVAFEPAESARYCFQVTYLNNRLPELCRIRQEFKLTWVVRNPYSVVYSMTFNWRESALNQLYRDCAASDSARNDFKTLLQAAQKERRNRLARACLCYCVRSSQLFELRQNLDEGRLFVLDYDSLVSDPGRILPEVFRFAGLTADSSLFDMLHARSINKAKSSLSDSERQYVEDACGPTYSRCLDLVTAG